MDDGIGVVRQTWRALAGVLPTLSSVVAALPRRGAHVAGKIRWFDLKSAKWIDSADLASPGAYRITRFSTVDVVRTAEDVDSGCMATSTVQLSKHGAALILGERALLAYNRSKEELVVPLGADLPGLYGRAAVLASGLLPTVSDRRLVYHQVPSDLAGHLAHVHTH